MTTCPPRVRFALAGALVLAASATTAAVVLQDGDVTVSAVRVEVEEVLKGSLPETLPIDQTPGDAARPEIEQQPLVPGHRYVLGVPDAHAEDGSVAPGRWAFFATGADGARLDAARKRWKDAIAHQNPRRVHPGCDDTVYTP
ncbi:hypothetical protein [Streptomyces hydrogenans]